MEIRILGSLAEKELTTPEYYPMTLNALVNACNQKTSRDPVVTYEASEVLDAVTLLIDKELVLRYYKRENRVPKFKHRLREYLQVNDAHLSLLTVLMLRGPQTLGELRSRTHRMYAFDDLAEVGERMQQLSSKAEHGYVKLLPRIPGQKEARYHHLLGPVSDSPGDEAVVDPVQPQSELTGRVTQLEHEIATLTVELDTLKVAFENFRKQFE